MENMYEKVWESSEYIKSQVKRRPKTAIILGSGLGALVDSMMDKETISYEAIPNFPRATVEGHDGKLVFGKIKGIEVMAMQGRFHYYEGYSTKEVAYPIYVMKLMGIEKLIITNACGGINTSFQPGTLMIIDDFINLVSHNPLIGENDERFGTRFPDMTEPFKIKLMNIAKEVAGKLAIDYKVGVYAGFMGPYYETRAEIKMIGLMGADAVGMSTVPETIAANYLGIDVLGIACITNMATGIQKEKHSHEKVVEAANKASGKLCQWIEDIIGHSSF
jgi:purine-nucleoside phosphorylase